MRYLSVASGIEAATVAWKPLGWQAAGFSEIEKFPSAVLKYHYPDVPNYGDMTKFKEWPDANIDVLVGGTPCQSFSIAGLRKGLDDPRGNLALVYIGIAQRYKPSWILWENVPGVLSSNGGKDFGTFLGGLAECGYGFAYRVLDAQYFGVPQRRRRVFVVGYLGDWRPAAAVLFERESLRRGITPSREKGEGVAGYTASSFGHYRRGVGTIREEGGDIGPGSETLAVQPYDVANCLTARTAKGMNSTLDEGQTPIVTTQYGEELAGTITARHDSSPCADRGQNAVAFHPQASSTQSMNPGEISPSLDKSKTPAVLDMRGNGDGSIVNTMAGDHLNRPTDYTPILYSIMPMNSGKDYKAREVDVAQPVMTSQAGGNQGGDYVQPESYVRRLTPVECERLQGFPCSEHTIDISIQNGIIKTCLDHQKNYVNAATKCLRLQNNVSLVEESTLNQHAKSVAKSFCISQAGQEKHAVVTVHINYEEKNLEIHKNGKELLSHAIIAENKKKYPNAIKIENFVQLVAEMKLCVEKTLRTGEVEKQKTTKIFTKAKNGSGAVLKSEINIKEFVKDVGKNLCLESGSIMSTISEAGIKIENLDLYTATLLCYVLVAIDGFTQKETLYQNSLLVRIITTVPYTQIPWRNKPVEQCPDGPRYKAIGNSMAVPVMRWIGERIQQVQDMIELLKESEG